MKFLALMAAVAALTGCVDATKATAVLQGQGYKDVQITGYNAFACSQDDFYHTGFEATAPSGQRISGTVCSGIMFKGSTIRFD